MRQLLAIFSIVLSWQVVSSLPMDITDDVYTIYWDGVTPTEIPRVNVANGKLMEVLVQFNEASSQGFVITDTHVYIPFQKHVRAQFAYNNAIAGEYHAGIINQLSGQQKDLRFGVDPVVLSSEKWHTLHYEGPWNQTTPSRPKRAKSINKAARDMAVERHATVLAQGFASGIGSETGKAAQDMHVITDIFDYATTVEDHLAIHQADIDALRQRLETSNVPERRHNPSNNIHTFTGCHHLERMGGLVTWSGDEEGAWIPLEKPIVSVTGLNSHMPAMHSVSHGTTVYMYDTNTDTLEYYVNHNSRYEHFQTRVLFPAGSDVNDIYGPDKLPAAVYVSPADGGISRPLPPLNGRFHQDQGGPSPVAKMLWDKLQTMPVDYTYFDRPTCPDSVRAVVDASLKNFDSNVFFDKSLDDAALAAYVQEQVVPTFAQAVACTSHFNRDGYSRQSPFAFTEGVAWTPFAHALMEIQPNDRLAFLSDAALDDLLIGNERCKTNEKGIRGQARSKVRCVYKKKQSTRKTKKGKAKKGKAKKGKAMKKKSRKGGQ